MRKIHGISNIFSQFQEIIKFFIQWNFSNVNFTYKSESAIDLHVKEVVKPKNNRNGSEASVSMQPIIVLIIKL